MQKILYLILILTVFIPSLLYAQTPFTPAEQAGVIDAVVNFLKGQHEEDPLFTMSLDISPRTPAPNDVVTARVRSFSTSLDDKTVVWTVNGEEVGRGMGKTTQEITMGAAGTTNVIRVSVILSSNNIKTETLTVRPGLVYLSWEARSATPVWYVGGALPSPGSEVLVRARPELRFGSGILDPTTLTYTWSLDGRPLRSLSGVGKNLFTFTTGNLPNRLHRISVVVSSPSGQSRGEGEINIPIINPEVLFYEVDPLVGPITQRTLQNTSIIRNNEPQLLAAPFFFSADALNLLEYNWKIGGRELDNSFTSVNTITLQAESGSFTETIAITIQHLSNIFQYASKTLQISVQNN